MLEKAVFQALVFLFPTQLALHFWPNWAHIFGIRVDYLSPAIYLTDILIGLIFIFWIKNRPKISQKLIIWGMAFLLFIVLNIYFSQNVFLTTFRWLKIIEVVFLSFYISTRKNFKLKKWIIQPLALSVIFFSLIGIFQFLFQRTIGGMLYYFGERSFSSATPGIALVELFGRNFLRIYSTFSHPNSLGGYLAASLILFLSFGHKSKTEKVAIVFCLLGIILSFSLGTYLGLFLVGIIYLFREKIQKKGIFLIFGGIILFSLFLPFLSRSFLMEMFVNNKTIMERLVLAEISQGIFLKHPILGAGLNNFLPISNELQPVHNIFLLILAETGIIGFFIFIFLLFKYTQYLLERGKWKIIILFLFILITGLVDHYWITLQQNLLLFSLVFGISFTEWKEN